MSHVRLRPSTEISASDLHSFFDNKVAGVRAATAIADAPYSQPIVKLSSPPGSPMILIF